MSTLPDPPFVAVEGIHNFRDIGGYSIPPLSSTPQNTSLSPSTSSTSHVSSLVTEKSVRRHCIYRCARPEEVTPTGLRQLRGLGVTTIFDLRSLPELKKLAGGLEGTEAWEKTIEEYGLKRKFVPAFKEEDYSPESIARRYKDYAQGGPEGFTRAYGDILDHAAVSFRRVFEWVRDRVPLGEACVVHCTAGKDRTGIFVALLLSLVGVPDDNVAEEYEKTEVGLEEWKEEMVRRLTKVKGLEGNREGAWKMFSAK